ncbi:MAG: hypothetical protein JL56_12850 [Desulfotomaculum sp. BICA1-6]|nr:MAG: hypothetical protein JL56_12850 [Desulfotomaculum sp. BICA1-6]
MKKQSKPTGCTPRERVRLAVKHREVDRIPRGELVIDDDVAGFSFSGRLEFVRRMGLDAYCLSPQYPAGAALPAARQCAFPDLRNWVLNTDRFIFGLLDGVFGWGVKLLGFERFITLSITSPLSLAELAAGVEQLNTGLITRLTDAGVNGIIIADDLAYQRGLFTPPAVIRKYVLPSLAAQVQAAQTAASGMPVFFHSDGNYSPIISDIIEAGFDGLHCLDRNSGLDLAAIRRQYGDRLCLWGSLDVADTLRAGEAGYLEGLRNAVLDATGGTGLILGTSSGIFSGMDMAGLMSVYRAFE